MRSRDTTQAGPPPVPSDGSHLPLDAAACASSEQTIGKLDAYLVHLAHLDMPIGMKIDLIAALHAIMQSFVDRAFGDDPVQQVRRAEGKPDTEDAAASLSVVDFDPTTPTETEDNELADAFRTSAERGGGRK